MLKGCTAMDDVVDVYSDQFQLNTSAYGAVLNFLVTKSTPPTPGSPPEAEKMATIRMSLEHLKVLTFVVRRQLLKQESETRVKYDVPMEVLNALRISPEDWEMFWKQD